MTTSTDPNPGIEHLPHSDRTLLTVEEAARRLSLGRTTLYALLKADEIASVRIGRLRRIPTEALAAYTARLIAEQRTARKGTRHDAA